MLKNLGKLFLALCVLTAGGVAANAQIDSGITIDGKVPFAFMAGNTKLPAGTYEIRNLDQMPGVLELYSVDGRHSVMVETENVNAQVNRDVAKTELIFDKVGDAYFLRQIWVAGTGTGSEVVRSRVEKALAGDAPADKQSVAAVTHKRKR